MRAEKQYLITEVETHLKKSDYVILANYTKVTVADVADLRAKLRAENAEFHVVKNSSLKVAAKALGLPEFADDAFIGPTAILVGGENPAAVAKIIKQFFKEKQRLEIKTGIMEKKVVTADFLSQIADLPSLNELRASFLSLLTSNAAAFVRVLDAKVKKAGETAPAPAAEAPAAEAAPAA